MNFGKAIRKFAALVLITVFAVATMLASGTNWWQRLSGSLAAPVADEEPVDYSRAAVTVEWIEPEIVEITQTYAGTIRPFERLMLGFEIGGRIDRLGVDQRGRPFDQGSPVRAGDELAILDTRTLIAQQQEAAARLKQAADELKRAEELRQRGAISSQDFLTRQTNLRVAEAQTRLLDERLVDARLLAPVDGVISKRFASAGESIDGRGPVFEIVQVERVLLVVGVPESQIRPLLRRQRQLGQLTDSAVSGGSGDRFLVYVELLGSDAFGNPWKPLQGSVYHIGETSDEISGLFEVEIEIANPESFLRPGQIARGSIVVDKMEGFRIPATAAIFDDKQTYLFCVKPEESPVEFLFWRLAPAVEYRAHRLALKRGSYLEQHGELIVRELPADSRLIVVRGQHRLVPNRGVLLAPAASPEQPDSEPATVLLAPPGAPASDELDSES